MFSSQIQIVRTTWMTFLNTGQKDRKFKIPKEDTQRITEEQIQ